MAIICIGILLTSVIHREVSKLSFTLRRCRFVQDFEVNNPSTHKGLDLATMTMAQFYKYWGLTDQIIDFVGHALALHREDSYLSEPALPTVLKIKLYNDSLHRFEGMTSPYIYPLYGLGELPQVIIFAWLGKIVNFFLIDLA